MNILGIETSCDDTAAAVIRDGSVVLSNIVSSQTYMHERYGGIIPEICSREHLTTMVPVVNEALGLAELKPSEIDGIAVTHGPGLAGSLLVGVNAAKGFAMAWDKPLIGINHLEGHIYSAWLEGLFEKSGTEFPLVCLIASGGHTELVLMKGHLDYELLAKTRDDAAGEAFDKVARGLRLGFPGGPEIQREAEKTDHHINPFPWPVIKGSLDFSFSGLKTAVVRRAEDDGFYPIQDDNSPSESVVRNYALAFQNAIVDCLVSRTLKAVDMYDGKGILIGGGVAANTELRKTLSRESRVPVVAPRPGLCTDNGAMIGAAAYYRFKECGTTEWDMDPIPGLSLAD